MASIEGAEPAAPQRADRLPGADRALQITEAPTWLDSWRQANGGINWLFFKGGWWVWPLLLPILLGLTLAGEPDKPKSSDAPTAMAWVQQAAAPQLTQPAVPPAPPCPACLACAACPACPACQHCPPVLPPPAKPRSSKPPLPACQAAVAKPAPGASAPACPAPAQAASVARMPACNPASAAPGAAAWADQTPVMASWMGDNITRAASAVQRVMAPALPILTSAPLLRILRYLGLVLTAIAAWMLLTMLLRTWLWRHFRARSSVHAMVCTTTQAQLLPSQRNFVDNMVRQLSLFDLGQPGPLWALEGRWGESKSFLAAAIQQRLEGLKDPHKPDEQVVATVYVHVWREQTESNLHMAIVEAILSHPLVLRHAFEAYPVARMLARKCGDAIARITPAGVKMASGEMSATLLPQGALPLMAQRDLEQVIARLRAKEKRVVLVLDEIDRAIPEVAQAAIVLCKRAFNLPGLAVLMPFVRAQLAQKTFNPLFMHSRDLYYTFLSHLQNSYPEKLMAAAPPSPAGAAANPAAPSAKDDKVSKDGAGATPLNDLQRGQMQWQLDFERRLLTHFSSLPQSQQDHLVDQSLEKYLSLRAPVPRLTHADLAHAINLPTVAQWLPAVPQPALLLSAMEAALTGIHKAGLSDLQPPVIRHLEGRLIDFFSKASGLWQTPDMLPAHADAAARGDAEAWFVDQVAALAEMAWRSAQHLSVNNLEGNTR